MKPFTLEDAIDYAHELSREWRNEERNAAMVGDIRQAVKCHQSAIVLEEFIRACQDQMIARNGRAA